MAKVQVLIKTEELQEKEELLKLCEGLKKNEKLKLQGFLEGLAFSWGRSCPAE